MGLNPGDVTSIGDAFKGIEQNSENKDLIILYLVLYGKPLK